jgi:hypothetical protein
VFLRAFSCFLACKSFISGRGIQRRSAKLLNFSNSRNRSNFFIYVIDIEISHGVVRANNMRKRGFCDFDLFVAETGDSAEFPQWLKRLRKKGWI